MLPGPELVALRVSDFLGGWTVQCPALLLDFEDYFKLSSTRRPPTPEAPTRDFASEDSRQPPDSSSSKHFQAC